MKALSLTQPWASTILYQGKRIENRQWAGCAFRGPILLHAAKGVGTISDFDSVIVKLLTEMDVPREYVESELATFGPRRGHASDMWSPLEKLPRGGIVGRARIAGEIRSERDMAAYAANVPGGEEQRRWWFGGFALVLADVQPIEFVPLSGELGLFEPKCSQCRSPATHARRVFSPPGLVCERHLDAALCDPESPGGWFEPLLGAL